MNSLPMSHTLGVAKERYTKTTLSGGEPSCDCNDPTARLLRGVPPEVVCLMADNAKGVPHGTHWNKYVNLETLSRTPNYGAIRLNAGNVIRAFLRNAK